MIKKIILSWYMICSMCYYMQAQNFLSCDLIFQTAGNTSFSQAIADATSANDSLKIIHIGILEVMDPDGDIYVIEANPKWGVREILLEDFLNDLSNTTKEQKIIVKRVTEEIPIDKILNKAKSHIGKPYDWYYTWDNDKIYCSELIVDSFVNEQGEPIFFNSPMNFKDENGNYPDFWIQLFQKLEKEIPQGEPGSNPRDIFYNSCLREIYRF